MIVELSHEEAQEISRYRVQSLFNSSQNQRFACPFCPEGTTEAALVLKTNLLIGNTD
jgi:hypothetical protein